MSWTPVGGDLMKLVVAGCSSEGGEQKRDGGIELLSGYINRKNETGETEMKPLRGKWWEWWL